MAPPADPPPSHRRRWLAALAGALPLIPIALGVGVGEGATGSPPLARTGTASRFTPVAPARSTPAASNPGRAPAPGAIVALLTRPTRLLARPGGRTLGSLGLRTGFGSPQALLVVATRPGWLGVLSPVAGNGHTGWIPRASASVGTVSWRIYVSLHRRQITVQDGDRTLVRYRTAIGAPGAPTPTGTFAVTDRLSTGDAAGPYGCCILALSARAPHAIQDWSGGDRIAIHATTETSSIGEAASHGCLRITEADARWLIAHVPLGTPVRIES